MSFPIFQDTFLSPKEDAKKNARTLMYQWTYSVLSQTGVDFDDAIPEDGDPDSLSILQRAKMRKILEINKIFILDQQDGSLEIYVDGELIGKWNKPYYKLCYDPTQVNPKKRYYSEVEISFGSVFDERIEEDNDG